MVTDESDGPPIIPPQSTEAVVRDENETLQDHLDAVIAERDGLIEELGEQATSEERTMIHSKYGEVIDLVSQSDGVTLRVWPNGESGPKHFIELDEGNAQQLSELLAEPCADEEEATAERADPLFAAIVDVVTKDRDRIRQRLGAIL